MINSQTQPLRLSSTDNELKWLLALVTYPIKDLSLVSLCDRSKNQLSNRYDRLIRGFHMIAAIAEFFWAITTITKIVAIIWKPGFKTSFFWKYRAVFVFNMIIYNYVKFNCFMNERVKCPVKPRHYSFVVVVIPRQLFQLRRRRGNY